LLNSTLVIVLIFITPFFIVGIMQQIGVLDKHSNLWEHATNTTKDILSQFNTKLFLVTN